MSTYDETLRKFSRLWRAIVEPLKYSDPERVAFVEARTRDEAKRKLRNAIAAIDECDPDVIEFYNLDDIRELLDGHFSEDHDMRIFETGSSSHGGVTTEHYCRNPLFLIKDPRALIDVWMKCPQRRE